jgi:uncharacterized protein (TIGR02448 family)
MHLRTALAATIATSIGAAAYAGEIKDPSDRFTLRVTGFPTTLTAATTMFTTDGPSAFKSAKSDALAFIGSKGEIRGALFEQAVREYQATYDPPIMSDDQLALAIVTRF